MRMKRGNMRGRIACAILMTYVTVVATAEADFRPEETPNTSVDTFKPENFESQIGKNYRRVATLESENNAKFRVTENRRNDGKNAEESHRKILEFGKRVLDGIKRYKILQDEASLLRSGKYRIDWWKKDRRLERMRKRLLEELARKPQLENHLNTLGWRGTTLDKNFPKKTSHSERKGVKKLSIKPRNNCKNSFLYKIMTNSLEDLSSLDSAKLDEQEAMNEEPIVFVYMKIVLARQRKIDRNDGIPTTTIPDSPMKFTLDTHEQTDFGTSDVGIIDIESRIPPMKNSIELSTSAMNSDGESIDTDRLLQLIPLIVDELRNDRMDNDERRALSWIFGKRLWQLLEREASKKSDETMDKDLAMFLIKGELSERDPEMAERRRRRPTRTPFDKFEKRKNSEAPIIREDDSMNNRNTDYDFESLDENYNDEAPRVSPLKNFYRDNYYEEKNGEVSLVEFLDLASTRREKQQELNTERERSKK